MSYAAVAALNTSGPQPTPDPALLTTSAPADPVADDTAKVNVVSHDFKSHPETVTSETRKTIDDAATEDERKKKNSRPSRKRDDGIHLWQVTKSYLARPNVLGGLVGLFNTGVLSLVAYYSYINWHKPTWDRRIISSVSVGLLSLWGVEGYLVQRYRQSRR